MVAILFAISGVAAVAGLGAILVGFPNYEFGLGNTLIMSGAVAIVGAMIVFGLAATVRELRRVGRLLERPARQPRPVDAEAAARAGSRPGAAARPQPLSPGRRAPEQRLGPNSVRGPAGCGLSSGASERIRHERAVRGRRGGNRAALANGTRSVRSNPAASESLT